MSKIKTRETHKNIKTLDKAAVATERMKDSFVRSREAAAKLSEDGQGSPSEYAGDQVQNAAADGARDAAFLAVEQGKKLAVKGRDAIRSRTAETEEDSTRHFFGTTPEETASPHDSQIERSRLYAKQTAQARAADPQRQPKTLDPSFGRQPVIKTPEAVIADGGLSPTEQGRQMAINHARIKAKEEQTVRSRVPESRTSAHPVERSVPRSVDTAIAEGESSPTERGRRLAIDRARIKTKKQQATGYGEKAAASTLEKQSLPPAYQPGSYSGQAQSNRIRQRQSPLDGGRVEKAKQESVRAIRQRDRTVRRSSRYLRQNGGRTITGSRRYTTKGIKTADRRLGTSIKSVQHSTMRARQAAQTAAVTAQRSALAARAAKLTAVSTAKAVSKATKEMARALATAVRSLFAAIAAGGTVAMVVIVVICLIGLIAGSCFGVVFASEDSGTGLTLQSAVLQINGELSGRIDEIKVDYEGRYDSVELINADSITNWPDVIAVYAVKTTTDKDSAGEVATVTQEKIDRLRDICWDMNPITAKLVAGEESTVLQITMTAKTYTDMIDEYSFNEDQKTMVTELMNSCLLDKYKNLTTPAEVEGDFPLIEGTGGYIWPLNGYTRISSPFGYRICPFHGRELHGGVDIPAPYGTPVHAAKSGRVVTSTYGSSYGNYIVLAHGDGTRTLYAHMSARLVSVGQTVSQGQTIGKVGSTGSSTGNHLHFETWTGSTSGTRVNPMLYF